MRPAFRRTVQDLDASQKVSEPGILRLPDEMPAGCNIRYIDIAPDMFGNCMCYQVYTSQTNFG